MDTNNTTFDFSQRISLYRAYDAARQEEFEEVALQFEKMRSELETLRADLADEKETRQSWRKKAQDAESLARRSQFILVLVDGDGYIFRDTYLREINESGGARAAHDLCTEVQDYLRQRNIIDPSGPEWQVMVNVYANRAGLAKFLHDADLIQHQAHLDQFFHSFTQSKPLFQFIDCGYGKERADAKLRDTFRFYAYDVHCKHIFLACCHDSGYVAELDKYRHDPIAAPKTILVDSSQMGRGYSNLNFPIARLDVFNTNPILTTRKENIIPALPPITRNISTSVTEEKTHPTPPPATVKPVTNESPATWSSITASSAPTPAMKTVQPAAVPATKVASPQLDFTEPSISQNKGIPVNRSGQRIDLKIITPSNQDLETFENRIAGGKLCNRYHLANDCYTHNCRYDHNSIDAKMKNTLRYKARSIPCQNGTSCRESGCFYGHQCPWGRDKCTNPKCAFVSRGMHNITDSDVAKYLPPTDEYY